VNELGVEVEAQKRDSGGPTQTTQNSDSLETHIQSLEHLENSVKWLQGGFETGYKVDIKINQLHRCPKELGDF
jgi:hypothetical protein